MDLSGLAQGQKSTLRSPARLHNNSLKIMPSGFSRRLSSPPPAPYPVLMGAFLGRRIVLGNNSAFSAVIARAFNGI